MKPGFRQHQALIENINLLRLHSWTLFMSDCQHIYELLQRQLNFLNSNFSEIWDAEKTIKNQSFRETAKVTY